MNGLDDKRIKDVIANIEKDKGPYQLTKDPEQWLRWANKARGRHDSVRTAHCAVLSLVTAEHFSSSWSQHAEALVLLIEAQLDLGLYYAAKKTFITYYQNPKVQQRQRSFTINRHGARLFRELGDFPRANICVESLMATANSREVQAERQQGRIEALQIKAANAAAFGDHMGSKAITTELLPFARESRNLLLTTRILRDQARSAFATNNLADAQKIMHTALRYDLIRCGTSSRKTPDIWVERGDHHLLDGLLLQARISLANINTELAQQSLSTAIALAKRLKARGALAIAQALQVACLVQQQVEDNHIIAQVEVVQQSIDKTLTLPDRAEIALICGRSLSQAGINTPALLQLEQAVALVEEVLVNAGSNQRDWLASQIDAYRWLIHTAVKEGQVLRALQYAEASTSRELRESVGLKHDLPSADMLQNIQQQLTSDAAVVIFTNADHSDHEPIAIVITQREIIAKRLSTSFLAQSLESIAGSDIRKFQRDHVELARVDGGEKISLGGIVALYRETIANHKSPYANLRIPLARALYESIIRPISDQVGQRKEVLIVPHGMLCYLPFSTLLDSDLSPLVTKWRMTLGHGFQISYELAQREEYSWDKPLIAFGGAIYNPGTYSGEMQPTIAEQGRAAYLHDLYGTVLDRDATTPYAAYAGKVSTNLPGTLHEVKKLAELIPETSLYIGREVSEPKIRQLSAMGAFTKHRCIHFAVHGTANPYRPELSALLLSRHNPIRRDSPITDDAFLSLLDVGELDLRSDMVVLSACETGQGAIYAGQGVIGLTQGFLSAGSDHVLASLWPVSDEATAWFMIDLYDLVLRQKIGWSQAMQKVQEKFILGSYGQQYSHPYFWAPFNVYGASHVFQD